MYTPQQIIARAEQLGITIRASGGSIKLIAVDKSLITDRMRSVIKAHKQALLDHFAALEVEAAARYQVESQASELCSVCFEPAAGEADGDGSMYCVEHHPGRQVEPIEPAGPGQCDHPIIQRLQDEVLGPCEIEAFTCSIPTYIAHRKRELEASAARRIEEQEQQIRDVRASLRERAYAAAKHPGPGSAA